MNLTSEVEIVQNTGLGALAIWAFCNRFFIERQRSNGPEIQLSVFVLPMVFHEETLDTIRTRRFEGGLFIALAQNRGISVELQERTEAMIPQTMLALNFAFASRLLNYNRDDGRLEPIRRTPPYKIEAESSRRIISASERLGYWFATINTPQMCSLLNFRF